MSSPKSTAKLTSIKEIERQMQQEWSELRCFESTADSSRPKYMVTFPYPYMNGLAHLGHSYSLSKCEFAISFHRLMGDNCLFPFAFHCTGMPIKVSCDRLALELSEGAGETEHVESRFVDPEKALADKIKSRRSKAASKSAGKSSQYDAIRDATQLDDVTEFTRPEKWIEFFPLEWKRDMGLLGAKVDWRRSFITTDANPFYDSFVGWFISKLGKYIQFGKRYTIYSHLDGQPCMDHDRSSGEGLSYTEFTLLKYRLADNIFLVAATRRPETVYGQVCCWVHPTMTYIYFTHNQTQYIANMHAIRNIQQQWGDVVTGQSIQGRDLIGRTVEVPYTERAVPVLPFSNIKDDIGTGIVVCVPSDSPDDYMGLCHLKNNTRYQAEWGVDSTMVNDIHPLPVVTVAELGTSSAPSLCKEMGVKGVNDSVPLGRATQIAYSRGFYEGVMVAGKYAGMTVQEARPLVKADLIREGLAMNYAEPDGRIVSRSGDVCVVALCDQWYIDYGNDEWKQTVRQLLGRLKLTDEIRNNFERTIDNLHEHAMSRSYGMGSRVPWDTKYLIESLSDSTVYNAFYTVSHLLQGNLNGSVLGPFGIQSQQMVHAVWDYIFYDGASFPEDCSIQRAHLDAMKREFDYWYPVDMRSSGKDLIQNHLTYYLYTHVAVWPEEPHKWPLGIRANGLLLLNNEKMSKSTGNFLTLRDCCNRFSADATRLTLADAGDSIDDANFSMDTANAALLRIHSYVEFCRDVLTKPRTSARYSIIDHAFESSMLGKVEQAYTHYYNGHYKDAIKAGFYEFMNLRDAYREMSHSPNNALLIKFIELQTLILSPVCPHICDYIWTHLLQHSSSIMYARWNTHVLAMFPVRPRKLDGVFPYISSVLKLFQKTHESAKRRKKAGIGSAVIWVSAEYADWQCTALRVVREMIAQTGRPDNSEMARRINMIPELSVHIKKLMPFITSLLPVIEEQSKSGEVQFRRDFDEYTILTASLGYLKERLKLRNLIVRRTSEKGCDVDGCYPDNPVIVFDYEEFCHMRFINRDRCCGFFEERIPVFNGESCGTVSARISSRLGGVKMGVRIFGIDGALVAAESLFNITNGQITVSSKIVTNLVYSVC